MRIKKRGFMAVAALAVAGSLVAGCSTGSSSDSSNSKQVENFNYLTSGAELKALEAMFSTIQKQHPQLKIKNDAVSGGGGSNLSQALQTRISAGDAPDTWQSHPGAAIQTYAKAGLLADMTALYKKEGWSKVIPKELLNDMTYKGKIYGVLFSINRINEVWYSKSNAKKAGFSVGSSLSWSEMVADIGKAKSAGIQPVCLGGKDPFVTQELLETAIMANIGADGWKQLTAGKLSWTDPRIGTAVNQYLYLLKNVNSNYTALTWDEGAKLLAQNQCAFLPLVDSAYGELLQDGAKDGIDFGYVAYPGTDKIVDNVADLMVASAKAKNTTAINEFMTGIGSADAEIAYQKIKGTVPVRTDADLSSLGAYQKDLGANVKNDAILQSLAFGQSNDPAITTAYGNAVVALTASGDVSKFETAMKQAFSTDGN